MSTPRLCARHASLVDQAVAAIAARDAGGGAAGKLRRRRTFWSFRGLSVALIEAERRRFALPVATWNVSKQIWQPCMAGVADGEGHAPHRWEERLPEAAHRHVADRAGPPCRSRQTQPQLACNMRIDTWSAGQSMVPIRMLSPKPQLAPM